MREGARLMDRVRKSPEILRPSSRISRRGVYEAFKAAGVT